MKSETMTSARSVALLLLFAVLFSSTTWAQTRGSSAMADLKESMIHHRAIEAAVWSMPLMNFKAMRDGMKQAADVGFNDLAYYSKIQSWKFQIATPNNTTPYVAIFWNVKDGPVVVELPASGGGVGIFGTLMDAWQRPLEDVGAKGKDGGRGGKYLILPPEYQGNIPAGYWPLHQKTYNGFTVLRPIIANADKENLQKAVAFVKKIRVYPLAEAANPPVTRHIDLSGKLIEAIVDFDAGFYEELNQIIQEEFIEEKDLAMMGMLKALGIKKGAPYRADSKRKEILNKAAKEAHAYLIDQYHNELIPPYYEGSRWTSAVTPGVPETGFTYVYPSYIDLDARGALYYAICTSAKNLGAASFYLSNAKDSSGAWLDGGNNYSFHVPAKVPAKDFWSVIAYDLESAAWIRYQPKVGVASSDPGLQVNKDGSVDVYFGPKAAKGKESNWIPTTPEKKFFLLFRFYGPEPAVFDKSWQLPDLEKQK